MALKNGLSALKTAGRSIASMSTQQYMTSVTTAFGANVWKLVVEPGDWVNKGDQLLILEAMKMEIAITAPCDGIVGDFLCRPGEQAKAGDKLVSVLYANKKLLPKMKIVERNELEGESARQSKQKTDTMVGLNEVNGRGGQRSTQRQVFLEPFATEQLWADPV